MYMNRNPILFRENFFKTTRKYVIIIINNYIERREHRQYLLLRLIFSHYRIKATEYNYRQV